MTQLLRVAMGTDFGIDMMFLWGMGLSILELGV
jgi:hypothetical protein